MAVEASGLSKRVRSKAAVVGCANWAVSEGKLRSSRRMSLGQGVPLPYRIKDSSKSHGGFVSCLSHFSQAGKVCNFLSLCFLVCEG